MIALQNGRFLSMDVEGRLQPIDRVPGEEPRSDETPVSQLVSRGSEGVLALVPGGALLVQHGLVRRAQLPTFLSAPQAFVQLGNEVMWATGEGLFASDGDRWFRLDTDTGPVRNVSELVPYDSTDGSRQAWVRMGGTLRRVRFDGSSVVWIDPALEDFGQTRSVARMDATRTAVATDRGVAVLSPQGIRLFRRETARGVPNALGAGGGWAWVAWGSELLRTNGERWETLARDSALGPGTRIAVDSTTGTTALVIDANGQLVWVEAEEVLRLSGLPDGAVVLDPAIELEAVPPTTGLEQVSFVLDGRMPPLSTRTSAPWGWGENGARRRDLSRLAFGSHTITVEARYGGGRTLRRSVNFQYVSPLGRVPSYTMDIAPLFAARCARCHANGVAQELSGYEALRMRAPVVRAAIREGRMPPDIQLDAQSVAVFTAWIDGGTPE